MQAIRRWLQGVLRRRLPDPGEPASAPDVDLLDGPALRVLEERAVAAMLRTVSWFLPLVMAAAAALLLIVHGDTDDVGEVSVVVIVAALIIVVVLRVDGRRARARSLARVELAKGLPREERTRVMRAIHSATPSSEVATRRLEATVARRRLDISRSETQSGVMLVVFPLVQVASSSSDGVRAIAGGLVLLGLAHIGNVLRTRHHARAYLDRAAVLSAASRLEEPDRGRGSGVHDR